VGDEEKKNRLAEAGRQGGIEGARARARTERTIKIGAPRARLILRKGGRRLIPPVIIRLSRRRNGGRHGKISRGSISRAAGLPIFRFSAEKLDRESIESRARRAARPLDDARDGETTRCCW